MTDRRIEDLEPLWEDLVAEKLFGPFHDWLDSRVNRVRDLVSAMKEHAALPPSGLQGYHAFHLGVLRMISDSERERDQADFEALFPEYISGVIAHCDEQPEMIRTIQERERFIFQPGDPFRFRIIKPLKRSLLWLSRIPRRSGNILRRLIGRNMRSDHIWHRYVPFRNLIIRFLLVFLPRDMIHLLDEYLRLKSNLLVRMWKIYHQLYLLDEQHLQATGNTLDNTGRDFLAGELDLMLAEMEQAFPEMKIRFQGIYEDTLKDLRRDFNLAGTIELQSRRLSEDRILMARRDFNIRFEELVRGWNNNHFALLEDWLLDNAIYRLRYTVSIRHNEFYNVLDQRLVVLLAEKAGSVSCTIDELIEKIRGGAGKDIRQVIPLLSEERHRLPDHLAGSMIPDAMDAFAESDLPGLMEDLEKQLSETIHELPERVAFIKSDKYQDKVRDRQIEYLSPCEMLRFRDYPVYLKGIRDTAAFLEEKLSEARQHLLSVPTIVEFNLESAILKADAEVTGGTDPVGIAVEGLERAKGKCEESVRILKESSVRVRDQLDDHLEVFIRNILKLTEKENILMIRWQITRAKYQLKLRELLSNTGRFMKRSIPLLYRFLIRKIKSSSESYAALRQRFGLTEASGEFSAEISAYLAQYRSAMEKLPFVYQRLYEVKPLENFSFFTGRNAELSDLEKAYSDFNNEVFAPVAIVGEKGSGITTLIEYFIARVDHKQVHRVSLTQKCIDEASFFDIFNGMTGTDPVDRIERLADKLTSGNDAVMIILENIQHLFLKKVGGFRLIGTLSQLISKTSGKVFWITSCSLFAWEYLVKTFGINDYFGHVVRMRVLDEELLQEFILRRNRVSGYRIEYTLHAGVGLTRKRIKRDEKEQQAFLERSYFKSMQDFAHGNMSLALIFWLRSTTEVTGNTIRISLPLILNMGFLKALSTDRLFTLYNLLLHETLTLQEHSEVLHVGPDRSRLILMSMTDDGILISSGAYYQINPLLYREVISLLQSRNIVH
ncbi:MAG: hypothetical protein JW861_09105 [Bacteroidales bacterium]|nr:hypothetical protein [Bacteroidales bacterium]